MLRKIIHIDQARCNGCGICVDACHEGAIQLKDGKAVLTRDDYCDGLGDCLPSCPVSAISFETREALAYDHVAVMKHMKLKKEPSCCSIQTNIPKSEGRKETKIHMQWPIQLKLVPEQASYFDDVNLIIAADCTSFAYSKFHERFAGDNTLLIACPKLDMQDYSTKICSILRKNSIRCVHVVRMEVPCCGGITHAVKTAIDASGKDIPYEETTISIHGDIK